MEPYLYFGSLGQHERQFQIANFVGLALEPAHDREIKHDLTGPLPYADDSIAKIQAQDVLEHLPFEKVPFVLDEIYRVLKPGGRFGVVNWHPRPREETTILGEPRGPQTELRLSPTTTIAGVEASGLKLARLIEIPPYHYGAIFAQPFD